jgi:hypothetical protein
MRVADAVEGYAANLVSAEAEIPVDDVFEAQFLDAWMGEAGATLDDFLSFVAHVEHIAVEQREGFLTLPLSRLQTTALENASLSPATTAAIVAFLSLRSRPKWREVPEGFRDSDRQPWRFRRQLSVLRKPLLQLDGADDPMIAVAPGLLRDAFVYTVRNYHRGDFPLRQLKPKMRSWTGTVRDRAGRLFSDEVAARLCEFGWQTESEVKITKLLRKHFDRDYGDVDVLAWNPASGRVLIIECKDVQYRKIHGEIAEQLADFRGEATADGKRDDLRKHLDRVDLVTRHLPAVSKHIGATIPNGVESHLVFKNPVPMEFALKHMAERVAVSIFDRLIDI